MLHAGVRRLCSLQRAHLSLTRRPARYYSIAVSSQLTTVSAADSARRRPSCPCWQPVDIGRWLSGVSRTDSRLVCAAKKGGGKAAKKQPPSVVALPAVDDPDFPNDAEEGEDFDEDLADLADEFESHDSDDEFGREDQEASPTIALGNVLWGEKAFQACKDALLADGMEDLELFAFRVNVARKKIGIRLDNLEDYYGSPALDQVADFSRGFYTGLEAALGVELAGEIDVEVSSPGAERELRLPDDLDRFHELPMKVQYEAEGGAVETKVLELESLDKEGGSSTWQLADVKANSPGKGRRLSKRMREQRFVLPVACLKKVNLHIDY